MNIPAKALDSSSGTVFLPLALFMCFITLICSLVFSQGNILQENKNKMIFLKIESVMPETGEVKSNTATGFVICEGYVLTNYHVIPKDNQGRYTQEDIKGSIGSRYEFAREMEFILSEPEIDLMLLKFKGIPPLDDLVEVQFGDPNTITIGDTLYSFGYPLGEDLTYKKGTLSSKDGDQGEWITDTPLNYGDSGAPIFNTNNEVVAIVRGGIPEAQGINYLIPINRATRLLDQTSCRFNVNSDPIGDPDKPAASTESVEDTPESRNTTNETTLNLEPQSCNEIASQNPIAYGSFTKCIANEAGDRNIFTFQASQGEKVLFRWVDLNHENQEDKRGPAIDIIQPDGTRLPNAPPANDADTDIGSELEATILQTGLHTIHMYADPAPVTYGLVLERLAPVSTNARPLFYFGDGFVETAIDDWGDVDLFTLMGQAGDEIEVNLEVLYALEDSTNQFCLQLRKPSGELFNTSEVCQNGTGTIKTTLPESGTFLVLVRGLDFNDSFRYKLQVRCSGGTCFPQINPSHQENLIGVGRVGDPMFLGGTSTDFVGRHLTEGESIDLLSTFNVSFSKVEHVEITIYFATDLLDAGEAWKIPQFGGQINSKTKSQNRAILEILEPSVLTKFLDGIFEYKLVAEKGGFRIDTIVFNIKGTPNPQFNLESARTYNRPIYFYEKGNALYNNEDYFLAVVNFTEAIGLNPTDDKFYNVRGSSFMKLGDYVSALVDYNEAIRLNPNVTGYIYNRANANYKLQYYQEAVDDYSEVIRLEPTNSKAYNGRGNAYCNLKQRDLAFKDYDKALELEPSNKQAKENRDTVECK